MEFLHIFLITITLFSSFLIFLSNNPVHSVLFLIFTIINSSIILFLFNAEFLGLIFIIIYVGAIAIFFLFVVMMLNVKIVKLNFLSFIPLITVLSFIGFFNILTLLDGLFTEYNFLDITSYNILIDNLSNIDVIGQSLYNYYISVFLIAGFILLIAMIGAICLTLKFSSIRKNELFNKSFFAGLSVLDYWFQNSSSAVSLSPETATFVCVLGVLGGICYLGFSGLFGSKPEDSHVPEEVPQPPEDVSTTILRDVSDKAACFEQTLDSVRNECGLMTNAVSAMDDKVARLSVESDSKYVNFQGVLSDSVNGHKEMLLVMRKQLKVLTEELELVMDQLDKLNLRIVGLGDNTSNVNLGDATLSEAAPASSVVVERTVHMVSEANINICTLFELFYGLVTNISYAEKALFIFV